MRMNAGTAALCFAALMCLLTLDQSFAGFFDVVPAPQPPAPAPAPAPDPVPEIDGLSGIAAIALMASIVAILFSRSRNRGK